MELFRASRLKIERAKQHINDLYGRMVSFAPDSYAISVNRNPETGNESLQIDIAKAVPDDFALIIGDALHNLKSALDFAVNDVVFARLRRWDNQTRFPMRRGRDDLITAINGALIHKASPAVCDFIVDIVKPYKGGNDALWALHDLNILDKHRLLLPVMQVSPVRDIRGIDERGKELFINTWVLTGSRRGSYMDCSEYGNLKITDKGNAALLIFFDHGLPMQGESVLPALHQLTELVSDVVDGIEKIFIAES